MRSGPRPVQADPSTPEPGEDLSLLGLLAVRLLAALIDLIGRAADLLLLLARPRLLPPYLRLWAAELRASPYRWPRSFEAVRAVREVGQTRRELMYGEILLATAVWHFWRAGLGRGGRLVDLGAGRGRALLAARWLGAEAHGVELLRSHVLAAQDAVASAGARLEEGDAGRADLAGATHVYLNWLALEPPTCERLRERLLGCAPGTSFLAVGRPAEGAGVCRIATRWGLFTWGLERVHLSRRVP